MIPARPLGLVWVSGRKTGQRARIAAAGACRAVLACLFLALGWVWAWIAPVLAWLAMAAGISFMIAAAGLGGIIAATGAGFFFLFFILKK